MVRRTRNMSMDRKFTRGTFSRLWVSQRTFSPSTFFTSMASTCLSIKVSKTTGYFICGWIVFLILFSSGSNFRTFMICDLQLRFSWAIAVSLLTWVFFFANALIEIKRPKKKCTLQLYRISSKLRASFLGRGLSRPASASSVGTLACR